MAALEQVVGGVEDKNAAPTPLPGSSTGSVAAKSFMTLTDPFSFLRSERGSNAEEFPEDGEGVEKGDFGKGVKRPRGGTWDNVCPDPAYWETEAQNQ